MDREMKIRKQIQMLNKIMRDSLISQAAGVHEQLKALWIELMQVRREARVQ
jgi:hypothetical protein